jgi:membrane-bound lytic murein transglycosylase D
MAIPIVESGYENLEQAHNKYQSAGIWQFIPRTARAYGLRVDAVADERLDPVLLTDAAARLLQAEHFSLGDWQLAALAYNMGGARVQKAIETTGSRDAWVLVRAGAEGDKGYLARLSAAALIMANPALIE